MLFKFNLNLGNKVIMDISHFRAKFYLLLALISILLFSSPCIPNGYASDCPQPGGSACTLCLSGSSNSSGNQAVLSWSSSNPPPNVHHYEIWKSDQFLTRFLLATTTQSGYTDTTAQVDNAYLYQVRAVDSDGKVLTISNWDLVTTVVMADDPLTQRETPVRAVHITDLRKAINAVRELSGLPLAGWAYPDISEQPVRAVDTEELRSKLAQALTILDLPVPDWTDPALSNAIINAAYLEQIRQAVK